MRKNDSGRREEILKELFILVPGLNMHAFSQKKFEGVGRFDDVKYHMKRVLCLKIWTEGI